MTPAAQLIADESFGSRFLDRLADRDGAPFDCSDVVLVVAHPDDETIAMGGQLARLNGVLVLHTTDGAPAAMDDAHASGFASAAAYAAGRRRELEAALVQAGVGPEQLLLIGVQDQTARHRLPFLAREIAAQIEQRNIGTVVTHAYEGGHPDHDATAFAVRAAAAMLRRQDGRAPELIEFPLYRAQDGQMAWQEFRRANPAGRELTLHLDDAQFEAKRRMLMAHASQQRMLSSYSCRVERFRVAAAEDFGALPNGGELFYERWPWGGSGAEWLQLADQACHELGLPQWL
jgi:N-acetylglucosamine malate deacetylase 2